MKKYDFDEIVPREGTDCLKYDARTEYFGREDVIPMWIADMDFKTPPFVMEALRKRLEHEVLGYTRKCGAWMEAIRQWAKMRYDWQVEAEWVEHVSGIVPAIAFAIQALTQKGDGVLIMPPVYPPYIHIPEGLERRVVTNPLRLAGGQFEVDFEYFEQKVKECKLFLLCHPHNPGGRVWRRDELERMAEICADNGVVVISDEIHADMTFKGYQHIPFATIGQKAAMNSITMMAASKSFNIAGLMSSFTIIPNPQLRAQYNGFLAKSELNLCHIFATIATAAALTPEGAEWLDQMIDYVAANVEFVESYLAENMPLLKIVRPQASYLIFLDCRELGLSPEELRAFFVDKARVAMNDGVAFGAEGAGFMRMNVGCPRSVVAQALDQILVAYKELIAK